MEFQCIFTKVIFKKKIFRQSWLKHLRTFLRFSHKLKVAKQIKNYDLSKLGNFKKIPKKLRFDGKYPASHPKSKFSRFFVKKWQPPTPPPIPPNGTIFHRKTGFAQFWKEIFISKREKYFVKRKIFSFLTRSRSLDLTFSGVFGISKDLFSLQIAILGHWIEIKT